MQHDRRIGDVTFEAAHAPCSSSVHHAAVASSICSTARSSASCRRNQRSWLLPPAMQCKGECIKLVLVVVYCLGATGDFSYLRSLPLYSCSRDIIRVPENLSLTDFLIFVAKSSSHLITSNVYACVCDLVHVWTLFWRVCWYLCHLLKNTQTHKLVAWNPR